MRGNILIISGPSGSGKSSLMQKVLLEIEDVYFSISTTTRSIREGEIDGVNYHFTSKEEFEADIDNGLFLEWAKVHENYYGTSLKPILKALHAGKIVVCDIDVQGHKIAREKFGNIITSVFLTTQNQEILRQRLTMRGTDSLETIDKRISNAVSEMTRIREYDYLIINDNFEQTLTELLSIAQSSRHKVSAIDTENFIASWASEEV
ncbi:MAG: guanylate kinase [Sulfurospirillum sp.]|nr:guanylate kinase [Sulfurospirillum sp.]